MVFSLLCKATLSKRSSQNYGKISVRTNDSQISLAIDFNADVHFG